ncbi:hypothetical protein [Bacillus changyiensis]|uniref:hypothetical protein n=1 Tax=Bacillus changyiensis TaxID=3004103 RepID=UPI0022E2010A|nr:hypothetical protein [Bacillus changyiensis]MDA1475868.1 hypothetical protein [Bacillus changyiensis]
MNNESILEKLEQKIKSEKNNLRKFRKKSLSNLKINSLHTIEPFVFLEHPIKSYDIYEQDWNGIIIVMETEEKCFGLTTA